MADNITAPAAGAIIATDQIGSVHYPRTKVGFGADGAYADVSADTPLPVTIVSGGGSGGGGGDASAANQATEIARLTSILGSVDGIEGLLTTANTLLGGTLTVGLPSGAATATGVTAVKTAVDNLTAAIGSGSGGGTVGGATETTLAALSAKLPASLGPKAISTSLSIVPATSSDMATNAGVAAALAGITFYPATQPISAASLPLPSGAATGAKQDAIVAALGTPLQAGGNVAVTASALPAGAATAAKQDTAITALQNSAPADDLFAITPSDTVALATTPKALLVTVAGNVAVRGTGSSPVTLAVTAGQILPIRARFVYATNTTATVVGLV